METKQVIEARRSIRRFQTGVLSKTLLTHLLELATKAPSGKNRQPWRFIVCQGEAKDKLLQIMKSAVAARQSEGMDTGSAEGTMQAMQMADAVVLVLVELLLAAVLLELVFPVLATTLLTATESSPD